MSKRTKFTTTAIDRLREPGIYWDTQTPGLGCRVSASGMRTYFYQRRIKGSGIERNVSLGRHGDPVLVNDALRSFPFGTDDARAKAAAVQAQMLAGVDPVQKLKDEEAATVVKAENERALMTTLRQVMDHYFEHHRTKAGRPLRPKTKRDYKDFMERNCASWLDQPAQSITSEKCLTKLAELGKATTTQAYKGQSYVSMFLNHARAMHRDKDGNPRILAVNPMNLAREIHPAKKIRKNKRRISLAKVGAVWVELRRRATNPVRDLDRTAADWVSTILLTGWRSTECAALQWPWINFDARTVTLPGDLEVTADNEFGFVGVKTHAAIKLPLSDVLFDLLKERAELPDADGVYVFPARAGTKHPHITTAHGSMAAVGAAAGEHISPHDIRRTTASIAVACRVDYALRECLLNHSSKNVHDDYERDGEAETLRAAVNAIANYVVDAGRVAQAQASGANVISLAGRGKTA